MAKFAIKGQTASGDWRDISRHNAVFDVVKKIGRLLTAGEWTVIKIERIVKPRKTDSLDEWFPY